MRWLLVAVALTLAASAGALALAVWGSRDPVPHAIRDCVREGGGRVVRGSEGLGAVRDDVLTGALRPTGPAVSVGRNRAVILGGREARVLVLASPRGASLDVPELPVTVFGDPSRYAVVAVERDPLRGLLARCVEAARAA